MLIATIATIGFDCKIELLKVDGTVADISAKTVGKKVVKAGSSAIKELKSDN